MIKQVVPDVDGLFDLEGVRQIFENSNSWAAVDVLTPDLALDVRNGEFQCVLLAHALGKWHGVDILKAITICNGRTPVEIDYRKVTKRMNLCGLNEDLITRVAAATGIIPYLQRSSNYRIAWIDGEPEIYRPLSADMRELLENGFQIHGSEHYKPSKAGELTWPLLFTMAFTQDYNPPSETIRLYYALQHIRLLRVDRSTPRLSIEWLPAAYLAQPTRPVEADLFTAEDDDGIGGLVT